MSEKRECPECKWAYTVNRDGSLRKHKRSDGTVCGSVSEVAPTVEETTTQGDDVAEKGPWFGAMYGGRCSAGECEISEGDRIRADGYGGYECEDCGDDESSIMTSTMPARSDWQAQASAAARRHVALQTVAAEGPQGDMASLAFDREQEEAIAFLSGSGGPAVALPSAEDFLNGAGAVPEPVMSVSGQPKQVLRDHLGRYAVVLPGETELEVYKSSGNPVGRTRATTFNKKGSDKKNINDWGKRNVLIGASRRRDLVLQATGLTHEDDKDRLNALVVQLEETAGSKVGSDLGTYLHEFTEYMDAGLKTPDDAPEEFRKSLRLYAHALERAGLEPIRSLIERTTIIREYGWVCGTFDRIFYHRPSGQYVIGDLKTGRTMDYGKNETETQLWIYAHGVNQNGIYDWNTRTWEQAWEDRDGLDGPIKVSESVGVVIHMPVQGAKEGTVELLWADLESGRAHAEVCAAVAARPGGKMRAWGDGPAPFQAPAEFPWEARFASVTSNAEATALWKMAKHKGITGVRLNELVAIAQRTLAVRG